MNKKRVFSAILIGAMLAIQIPVFALEENGQTYGTEVNEQARLDAYKEYAAPEAEREVDIVPLFEDWNGKKALKKVNNIGNKLLLSNKIDDFARFEVSRKEAVNAYASYEGVVHVYKGLLNYVENDDELAFVIGHELGHITNDDNKKSRIRRGIIIAAAAAGGVAVGAGSRSGSAGGATAGGVLAGGGLASKTLSRRVEARADIAGIDYMVKAGYNPLAAISMMNKIMNRRKSILSTHPSGDKRMISAYKYIAKKYPKYLLAGFNTISYERAMVVIQKSLAEDKHEVRVKQSTDASDKNTIKTNDIGE